jgi:hypothetical protein
MPKRSVKFSLGDVVQLNKFWDNRIGIVVADDTAWYVIRDHYSIANCICEASDVVRVVIKGAIPKKWELYI